jgi:hypothetical protein
MNDFLKKFLLVFKIIVNEGAVDARLLADAADSGAFQALGGENNDGRLQDGTLPA